MYVGLHNKAIWIVYRSKEGSILGVLDILISRFISYYKVIYIVCRSNEGSILGALNILIMSFIL